MVRVSLAFYLMFATATGPWLCCCSSARLLGRPSATTHAPTTGGSCCNHQTASGHHVPGHEQHPETPSSHDPCPCKDSVPEPVTISVAKGFLNAESARSVAVSHEFAPCVFGAADPLTWYSPAMNAGFAFASLPNPRDILSVLQTLRI